MSYMPTLIIRMRMVGDAKPDDDHANGWRCQFLGCQRECLIMPIQMITMLLIRVVKLNDSRANSW